MADLTRCPHCGRSLRYMTVREAADELGVARMTVHRYIERGTVRDVVTEEQPGGIRYLVPTREVMRLKRAQAAR